MRRRALTRDRFLAVSRNGKVVRLDPKDLRQINSSKELPE